MPPNTWRVGGFREVRKVAQIVSDRGRRIVPYCWDLEFLPAPLAESALPTKPGLGIVDAEYSLVYRLRSYRRRLYHVIGPNTLGFIKPLFE